LKEYGKTYLEQNEYEQYLQIRINNYYHYLGNKFFNTWDKNFWNYHRSIFERVGCRLDWAKVIMAAIHEKLEIMLFPIKKVLKMKVSL